MAQLIGVAGLPRSGSSLLQCILAQNPAHYCTGTSPFLMELEHVELGLLHKWRRNPAALATGYAELRKRVYAGCSGYIRGFYAPEFQEDKTVFDKNRVWPLHRKTISDLLQANVKVVLVLRDLRAVVASMERLYQARRPGDFPGAPPMLKQRVERWLHEEGLIGGPVSIMRGITSRESSFMVPVYYGHLVTKFHETLASLHEKLELPEFEYSSTVTQLVEENDEAWGLGETLHKIREGEVTASSQGWDDVLPEDTAHDIRKAFPDFCTG